jgi:polyhydroxyalkanoate synthesis regulator phasin
MSNPLVHAFFVGRAAAEIVSGKLENAFTDALSELGKFDAEAREQLRQFTEQVTERAEREMEMATVGRTTTAGVPQTQPTDLQATIDDLRAEIALLRAELQRYRSNSL